MSIEGVIRGARIFDGTEVIERGTVVVRGSRISQVLVGDAAPEGIAADASVVDGTGCTVLPGLIDAHTHPTGDALALAILFGVTTEYDMFTTPDRLGSQKRDAKNCNDLADIRSASTGATVLGGHPSMLIGLSFAEQFPVVTGTESAARFVRDRIAEGADFIKLLIDDGSAMGHPAPTLDEQCARIIVAEAHAHDMLVVAHATSRDCAMTAVRSGVDGLVHIFVDQPADEEIIDAIRTAGIFVTPTLVTMGSMTGELTGGSIADDPRTAGLMPDDWRSNMCTCWQLGSPSKLANGKQTTLALHRAGVRLLAGTDAADVGVLGTAHGASLHQELQLLVESGLTPVEALTAATSVAAEAFGLADRGRLVPGRQADMVLVEGDPTTRIADTLSIRSVWRRGTLLDRSLAPERIKASSAALPYR
jgi:imidazolonepropionase-like amidohydrolase